MTTRPDAIEVEVARELFNEFRANFIDARPQLDYEHSREHIPGAIHVRPGAGAEIDDMLSRLPRERLFIAYCDEPGQAASAAIARRVRALGIGDGCFLHGGLRAWKEAGLPTEVVLPPAGPDDEDREQGRYQLERIPGGDHLAVSATTLPDLFAEAARAVTDRLGLVRSPWSSPMVRQFTLTARYVEVLLDQWLRELIAHTGQVGRVFSEIAIQQLDERQLRAEVRGWEAAGWRIEPGLVSVSSHLERPSDGFAAMIELLTLPPGRPHVGPRG